MICKLIACGADRAAAIATMRDALNGFVDPRRVEQPRVPGGAARPSALRRRRLHHRLHRRGVRAAASIPAATAHPDRDFLLALAAAFERRLLARSAGLTGQLPGHELQLGARLRRRRVGAGRASAARRRSQIVVDGADYRVTLAGRTRRISFASPLADLAVHGRVDGAPFRAEIERVGLALRVAQHGARVEVRVLTPRAAELLALMPFKPPPDLSRFLLSPMPGLLVHVAVEPGQSVRAGERLAVIEAMKMENVVVAAHDGVVERSSRAPARASPSTRSSSSSRRRRSRHERPRASARSASSACSRSRSARLDKAELARALGRPARPRRHRLVPLGARERRRGHLRRRRGPRARRGRSDGADRSRRASRPCT